MQENKIGPRAQRTMHFNSSYLLQHLLVFLMKISRIRIPFPSTIELSKKKNVRENNRGHFNFVLGYLLNININI